MWGQVMILAKKKKNQDHDRVVVSCGCNKANLGWTELTKVIQLFKGIEPRVAFVRWAMFVEVIHVNKFVVEVVAGNCFRKLVTWRSGGTTWKREVQKDGRCGGCFHCNWFLSGRHVVCLQYLVDCIPRAPSGGLNGCQFGGGCWPIAALLGFS